MSKVGLNRRRFLQTSGVAVAAAAGAGVGARIFDPSGAWAIETSTLNTHQAKTLLAMARQLFPHDFLGDEYYARVVEALDGQAAADADTKKQLTDGIADLDGVLGIAWVDLSNGYQLQLLEDIDGSDFFNTVRGATLNGLYNDPLVWRYFGYEGSSVEFGGYINRGFNDIGWLPKV